VATIEAGGLSVEHHLTGSGAPVVLLHGLFAASSASWYFTCAPGLSEHFRLLLYDLRGHGRTQRAKSGYDTATLQADLGALLDALSWNEPVSLVGHSYGGLIALAFALRHPDRVARLALVDAPLPPSTLPHLEEFFSRGPGGMAEALPPPMRAFLERGSRQSTRLLKNLSAESFTKEQLLKEIEEIRKVSREPLAKEKKATEARKEAPPGFGPPGTPAPQAPDLITFAEKRTASVAAQLAGKSKGYTPTPLGPPAVGPRGVGV